MNNFLDKSKKCRDLLESLQAKIDIDEIKKNFDFTRNQIDKLKNEINEANEAWKFIKNKFTIILIGSYGRLESSHISDLDFCIIYNDGVSSKEKKMIKETINSVFEKIFSKKISLFLETSFSDIITNIGGKDDSSIDLTTRILILMESIPLIGDKLYNKLISKLCKIYLEEYIREGKYPLFLTNEIIRFWRTLCIDYRWKKMEMEKPWATRNIKLRFSRKLLCYATLILSVFLSKGIISQDEFQELITYPSSIKILYIYGLIDKDKNFSERSDLLECIEKIIMQYDDFLKNIYNTNVRKSLEIVDFKKRDTNDNYINIKEKAKEFHNDLVVLIEKIDINIVKKYLIM